MHAVDLTAGADRASMQLPGFHVAAGDDTTSRWSVSRGLAKLRHRGHNGGMSTKKNAKSKRRGECAGDGVPADASSASVLAKRWGDLTWKMLEEHVGPHSLSRGRKYQSQGRVTSIATLPDGRVLAEVEGRDDYILTIDCGACSSSQPALTSRCSCPMRGDCKHVAAAVIELLGRLERGEAIDCASASDRRIDTLEEAFEPWARTFARLKRERAERNRPVVEYICAKSQSELADWMCRLLGEHPELFEDLRDRLAIQRTDVKELVRQTRKVIDEVTGDLGWDGWDNYARPDYEPVQRRLKKLFEAGQFESLVELGERLFQRGMEQIGRIHDEGETTGALAECMAIVLHAVAASDRTGVDKQLYLTEMRLGDDYGILDCVNTWPEDLSLTRADWSQIADRLALPLSDGESAQRETDTRDYERSSRIRAVADALERAGRDEDVRAIREREARERGEYDACVSYFLDRDLLDEAEQWAIMGIRRTDERWLGLISGLLGQLRQIAIKRDDRKAVAAFEAFAFFDRPTYETFTTMLDAAAKARCKQAVRRSAIESLEVGVIPWWPTPSRRKSSAWPIEMPDILLERTPHLRWPEGPRWDVLLELALGEKDIAAIMRWYDALAKADRSAKWRRGHRDRSSFDGRVAAAIAKRHPRRAIEIWRSSLPPLLEEANTSNYDETGKLLERMRPVYERLDAIDEWQALVTELRTEYRRRPRFVEVLDRLTNPTIMRG